MVLLKRKVLWVVAVAVSVTVLAAVLVWSVLTPQLAPGSREVRLTMMEFGFNGEQGGPTVYVGVGETLRIVLENRGKGKHQFMIVKDLEGLRKELRNVLEGSVDGGSEQLENRLERCVKSTQQLSYTIRVRDTSSTTLDSILARSKRWSSSLGSRGFTITFAQSSCLSPENRTWRKACTGRFS